MNVTPRTIRNRGFSVSSIRTEKMVLYGAWVLLHFLLRKSGKGKNDLFIFGQAKKEDKNPASNRTILNHQYSKLNE